MVNAPGHCLDRAAGRALDGLMVDCLSHGTVLLIGDAEGATVSLEQKCQRTFTGEDTVVLPESYILKSEIDRALPRG